MAAQAAVPVQQSVPVQSVRQPEQQAVPRNTEPAVQTEAPQPAPVQQPVQQAAPQPVQTTDNSAAKPKIDTHSKKFKMIIAAAAAVCCLAVVGIVIGVNSPKNVVDMPYSLEVSDSNSEGVSRVYKGTYTGRWQHGKPNGQGTINLENGSVFEGEWKDGNRDGYGTFTYGQKTDYYGDTYEGEYKDNLRNGQGTYTFADGTTYVGEWKDGKPNGQGTMTYADGAVYVGEWKDSKYNGQGTLTYADGTVKTGTWQDNKFVE